MINKAQCVSLGPPAGVRPGLPRRREGSSLLLAAQMYLYWHQHNKWSPDDFSCFESPEYITSVITEYDLQKEKEKLHFLNLGVLTPPPCLIRVIVYSLGLVMVFFLICSLSPPPPFGSVHRSRKVFLF